MASVLKFAVCLLSFALVRSAVLKEKSPLNNDKEQPSKAVKVIRIPSSDDDGRQRSPKKIIMIEPLKGPADSADDDNGPEMPKILKMDPIQSPKSNGIPYDKQPGLKRAGFGKDFPSISPNGANPDNGNVPNGLYPFNDDNGPNRNNDPDSLFEPSSGFPDLSTQPRGPGQRPSSQNKAPKDLASLMDKDGFGNNKDPSSTDPMFPGDSDKQRSPIGGADFGGDNSKFPGNLNNPGSLRGNDDFGGGPNSPFGSKDNEPSFSGKSNNKFPQSGSAPPSAAGNSKDSQGAPQFPSGRGSSVNGFSSLPFGNNKPSNENDFDRAFGKSDVGPQGRGERPGKSDIFGNDPFSGQFNNNDRPSAGSATGLGGRGQSSPSMGANDQGSASGLGSSSLGSSRPDSLRGADSDSFGNSQYGQGGQHGGPGPRGPGPQGPGPRGPQRDFGPPRGPSRDFGPPQRGPPRGLPQRF